MASFKTDVHVRAKAGKKKAKDKKGKEVVGLQVDITFVAGGKDIPGSPIIIDPPPNPPGDDGSGEMITVSKDKPEKGATDTMIVPTPGNAGPFLHVYCYPNDANGQHQGKLVFVTNDPKQQVPEIDLTGSEQDALLQEIAGAMPAAWKHAHKSDKQEKVPVPK